MATYAACQTERRRLLALGQRLQVRLVRAPYRGNDGADYPDLTTNDFMLMVHVPSTSRMCNAALGGRDVNATLDHATARILGRHPGGANEDLTRIYGRPITSRVGARLDQTSTTGWKLYEVGSSREGTLIPDSVVTFS